MKNGSRQLKLLRAGTATYLGIGLLVASWAASTWPKGVVHEPVLVFLQNMLLWPIWLPAVIAMGGGRSSH